VSANVEKEATPLPFKVALPSASAPSIKFTVPVGAPTYSGLTVAVSVSSAELELDVSTVVLLAFTIPVWITWVRTGEVLALKLLSPL
jgi:hypothetical protein